MTARIIDLAAVRAARKKDREAVLTARIRQIIADLIEGDGPYLRREAVGPYLRSQAALLPGGGK
jgi:hypothetical protein